MNDERWERLRRVFSSAVERRPDERPEFLDRACEGDPQLRQDLEPLLASREEAGGFLETPALADVSAPGSVGTAAATLAAGTRLGPYEIAAAIGSGGMGVV